MQSGQMKRREVIALLSTAAIAVPVASTAQETRKVPRIGFMRVGAPPAGFMNGLRQGLRALGFVEGQHFAIEYVLGQSAAQMPAAAAELVRRRVDLILASGTPSALPARDVAGPIPVVFVGTFDPVASGLIVSLARPGRNITGMTSISGDLIAKRLEITRELIPGLRKIAVLVRDSSPTKSEYLQELAAAARILDIEVQILTEHSPDDLEPLLATALESSALIVGDDAEFTDNRDNIAKLALEKRLPTVFGLREMVEAGGLLSYGANFGDLYRRAASQIYKILHGANPAEIPVEQPTKFELLVNMRTARALSLTVSPVLLARVDEVIE